MFVADTTRPKRLARGILSFAKIALLHCFPLCSFETQKLETPAPTIRSRWFHLKVFLTGRLTILGALMYRIAVPTLYRWLLPISSAQSRERFALNCLVKRSQLTSTSELKLTWESSAARKQFQCVISRDLPHHVRNKENIRGPTSRTPIRSSQIMFRIVSHTCGFRAVSGCACELRSLLKVQFDSSGPDKSDQTLIIK